MAPIELHRSITGHNVQAQRRARGSRVHGDLHDGLVPATAEGIDLHRELEGAVIPEQRSPAQRTVMRDLQPLRPVDLREKQGIALGIGGGTGEASRIARVLRRSGQHNGILVEGGRQVVIGVAPGRSHHLQAALRLVAVRVHRGDAVVVGLVVAHHADVPARLMQVLNIDEIAAQEPGGDGLLIQRELG